MFIYDISYTSHKKCGHYFRRRMPAVLVVITSGKFEIFCKPRVSELSCVSEKNVSDAKTIIIIIIYLFVIVINNEILIEHPHCIAMVKECKVLQSSHSYFCAYGYGQNGERLSV